MISFRAELRLRQLSIDVVKRLEALVQPQFSRWSASPFRSRHRYARTIKLS